MSDFVDRGRDFSCIASLTCSWCEAEIPDGEGLDFEPEPGSASQAPAGVYCSISCWLAAS